MAPAGIGVVLICSSVFGLCRVYRLPATLPVVAVALFLVQVGVVHPA